VEIWLQLQADALLCEQRPAQPAIQRINAPHLGKGVLMAMSWS
jgi:hypothetical protein